MNLNKNISEENFNRIDRYLGDLMPKEERISFEKELKTTPSLQFALEELKELEEGVERALLKQKLNDFHAELPAEDNAVKRLEQSTRSNRSVWYAVAAVFVIAMGVLWVYSSEPTNEKLFAKYFTPDPGLPTVMSTSSNYDFYDAMVDYKRENYSIAIQKWTSLQAIKPNNDTLNYFLGVAQLANKNEAAAMMYLKKVSDNSQNVFYAETNFYLGLAQLQANDIEAAKKSFGKSSLPKSKLILEEITK